MHPKFRRLVLATATVIAVAATTVALPGSAEARWGWRGGGWGWGWGGFGVGLWTGLLLATAARPYYGGYYGYGYPAYSYGYSGYSYPAYSYGYSYPAYSYGFIATDILSDILALTMDGTLATITPIVGPTMDMPAIRIVDRPTSLFRGAVNCLTNIKERPPSGGLFFLNAPDST